MPRQDDAGSGGFLAVAAVPVDLFGRQGARGRELPAQEGDGVRLQGQAQGPVIGKDVGARRHGRQRRARGVAGLGMGCEQGQLGRAPEDVPQRLAPVAADGAEGIRFGQALEGGVRNAGTAADIGDADVPPAAFLDHMVGVLLAQPSDLAQAKPERQTPVGCRFQRIVPMAHVDVGGPYLDAMLAGVAHDLRRRIEAHGLCVQQGAGKRFGMVALEP